MSEATFGKVYHTKDGRTVYVNEKTGQASVFEGLLTIDKILEPAATSSLVGPPISKSEVDEFMQKMFPALAALDIIFPEDEGLDEELDFPDILGPKDYYVLVSDKVLPISTNSSVVRAWVSEFKNGHHPDYKDFVKYRILPEQWNWLQNHKNCTIMAWYEQSCPGFIALGCQDHAKVIKPISIPDEVKSAPTGSVWLETGTVHTGLETVLGEERDV